MKLRAKFWVAIGIGLLVGGLLAVEFARDSSPALGQTAAVIASNDSGQAEADFQQKVSPLLKQYCYQCHGNGVNTSGLEIDSYKTAASAMKDAEEWEKIQKYVHTHEMPPTGKNNPQPSDAERAVITQWVDAQLNRHFTEQPDPGRVTIHRLNRAEYNATIHDLVGVDFRPADEFPADDSGYGFDNVGDVLSVPQMLAEKYMAAAKSIMDQAIVTDPITSQTTRIPASLAEVGFNAFGDRGDGWVKLVSLEEDDVAVTMPVLAPGDYKVRVMAYATTDGGVNPYDPTGFGRRPGPTLADYNKGISKAPTRISLMLNDAFVKDFEVTTDEAHPGIYEARMGVPAGRQRFRASVRRVRGGEGELFMKNGRLGKEQSGIVYVKYMEIEGPLQCATRRYPAATLSPTGEGSDTPNGGHLFTGKGAVGVDIDVPADGDFLLRAQAFAMQAGEERPEMTFRVDDKVVKTFAVIAPGKMVPLPKQQVFSLALLQPVPQVYEVPAHLTAGKHHFSASFDNPFSDPTNTNPNLQHRTLTIQHLEVADLAGSVPTPDMPKPIGDLFAKYVQPSTPAGETREAAQSILSDFGRRAWRRPLQDKEIAKVMSLFDLAHNNGDTFKASVKLGMEGVLISPHFLFRGEVQADPNNPNAIVPIDEYALASRLSYFIWSSTPDDELLDLAARGQLRANLEAQVKRMLASPKSQALVDNFGGQWLQFRGLETAQPDSTIFTNYDAALRLSMQGETQAFFTYILRQDRPVLDFLDADYTFVNSKLAKLYGIDGITGDDFQKVSLQGTPRRGVLTQASVLTLTSNPTRTSPVKRGKWILENILGAPPPPPPPDVPPLIKDGQPLTGSLRKQMEQHRVDPNCASCHARMDPIGFGFENFDGIGQWRDKDGNDPVDSSGTLLTGETFNTGHELIDILATARRDDFVHCMAEKMMTYALGRGVEVYDHAAMNKIVDGVQKSDYRFSSMVLEIVESTPFQMRRGEATTAASAR
jgi:mono/diheme cytochrome c family protein